jgi:transcriptional regulator with XRE-family HTH domain
MEEEGTMTVTYELDGVAFGRGVRRMRLERGWTEERLAREADVPLRWVQRVESGRSRDPHHVNLMRVALALGSTPEELERLGRANVPDATPGYRKRSPWPSTPASPRRLAA